MDGERDPLWLGEVAQELSRIQGAHAQKKRNTVVALVQARLAGKSDEMVWKRDNTCSRSTFHRPGGWGEDVVISSVLENATRIAKDWRENRGRRAVERAIEALQLYSPIAANHLFRIMESESDVGPALRAALLILDRAGIDTAQKLDHVIVGHDAGDAPRPAMMTDEQMSQYLEAMTVLDTTSIGDEDKMVARLLGDIEDLEAALPDLDIDVSGIQLPVLDAKFFTMVFPPGEASLFAAAINQLQPGIDETYLTYRNAFDAFNRAVASSMSGPGANVYIAPDAISKLSEIAHAYLDEREAMANVDGGE